MYMYIRYCNYAVVPSIWEGGRDTRVDSVQTVYVRTDLAGRAHNNTWIALFHSVGNVHSSVRGIGITQSDGRPRL